MSDTRIIKPDDIDSKLGKEYYSEDPLNYRVIYPSDDSNDYIDIEYLNKVQLHYINKNMSAYTLVYNFMLDYIIYNVRILHKPLIYNLYQNIFDVLMYNAYCDRCNTTNSKYEKIYDYIKMDKVYQDTIFYALANAQIMYMTYPNNIYYKNDDDKFILSAKMIKEFGKDYIDLYGIGRIKTSHIDIGKYKNKSSIRILKSNHGPWYLIDFGTFITEKIDTIDRIVMNDGRMPLYIHKEIDYIY